MVRWRLRSEGVGGVVVAALFLAACSSGSAAGSRLETDSASVSSEEPAPPAAATVGAPPLSVNVDDQVLSQRERPEKPEGGNGKGRGRPTTTASTSTTLNSTTTTAAPSTTTTTSSTTITTAAPSTTTTTFISTTTVDPGSGPCYVEPGGTVSGADYVAMAAAGKNATDLNGSNETPFRSVYALPVPEEMAYVDDGLRLRFDVAAQPSTGAWTNDQSRSEMRTARIDLAPIEGSTVAYCMYFDADHPDLYGPTTIFQAFSRELDGPALNVELTGLNQFSNAVANEIQVVAYGERHRISGAQLRDDGPNALQVVIHYGSGSGGAYQVSLNGRVLRRASGLDTMSDQGIWWQYGLYLHGLKGDPATDDRHRRRDQLASGGTLFESTYRRVERVVYLPGERSGGRDLSGFGTHG